MTYKGRDEEIDEMRKEYDERRKLLVEGFRNMGLCGTLESVLCIPVDSENWIDQYGVL